VIILQAWILRYAACTNIVIRRNLFSPYSQELIYIAMTGHGALDIFTLSIWEVVGGPVEAYKDRRLEVMVEYDSRDNVVRLESKQKELLCMRQTNCLLTSKFKTQKITGVAVHRNHSQVPPTPLLDPFISFIKNSAFHKTERLVSCHLRCIILAIKIKAPEALPWYWTLVV
jgi:hypothetical protein